MTVKDIMDVISILLSVEISIFAKIIIVVVVALPAIMKTVDMYYEVRIKREKFIELLDKKKKK